MSGKRTTRREFLRRMALLGVGIGVAAPVLAACGPTPTPQVIEKVVEKEVTKIVAGTPVKEVVKEVVKETVIVEKPVTIIVEKAAPAAPKAVTLRFMSRLGPIGDVHREFSRVYMEKNPGITVKTEDTVWSDVRQKVEAQFITGTCPDLVILMMKHWPLLAIRGAFQSLDELMKAKPPEGGLADYAGLDYNRVWMEGKNYALADTAGYNCAITFFNNTLLKAAGTKTPTDDWTIKDLTEIATQVADTKKGIFGVTTALGVGTEPEAWVRRWGGQILTQDLKKITFTDPKTQDAIKWGIDLIKKKVIPGREGMPEGAEKAFLSGKLALDAGGEPNQTGVMTNTIGKAFELGYVLEPKGPAWDLNPPGRKRGFTPYHDSVSIYSKTKYPEETYRLALEITSFQAGMFAILTAGSTPGRVSPWREPEVAKKYPMLPKCADLMQQSKDIYPVPWNTRFQEWSDYGNAEVLALYYGETPYNDTEIQRIQQGMEKIINLPRP